MIQLFSNFCPASVRHHTFNKMYDHVQFAKRIAESQRNGLSHFVALDKDNPPMVWFVVNVHNLRWGEQKWVPLFAP
jgi:hypothetical protein